MCLMCVDFRQAVIIKRLLDAYFACVLQKNNHPSIFCILGLSNKIFFFQNHISENPSISLDEIPLQSDAYRIELERCKEIRDYLNCTKRYPSNSTQRGIHMPPIDLYGIKRILFQENSLPQLVQALSGTGSQGITYLENIREISKRNPAFIESVKNLLQSGALTIDDPIENQDILQLQTPSFSRYISVNSTCPLFHAKIR